MWDYIKKKFSGKKKEITADDILPEDASEINDVFDAVYDDKELMQEINEALVAIVVSYNFSPNLAPFVGALKDADITGVELAVIMFRAGSVVQYLLSDKRVTLELAHRMMDLFSEEVQERIEAQLASLSSEEDVEDIDVPRSKRDLNADDLANKLIDEYLKDKKDKDKDNDADKDS